MMLLSLITAGQLALANDMETLFDEAATGKKSVSTTTQTTTPLFYVLQTQIPRPTAEQSLFIRYVESAEWDKALLQYSFAFEGTSFQKSSNGRALYALVHFNAGLPVAGLELLFKDVENPGQVHAEIRTLWKTAAKTGHPAWDLAQIKWRPAFSEIFSPEIAFKVEVRDLASMKDIKALSALYTKLPSNSLERARAGWQLVTAYALQNQVEESAKTLALLMKSEPFAVSKDLMELTAARLLYQRGFFQAAIKYYEKVDKNSEYWTDAQEEMAWSYVRRGEPNNAIAISKSLVLPAMAVQAGAEGFFVHGLGLLKICDYPGVIESLQVFRDRFKPRVEMLDKLAKSSEISEAKKLSALLMNKRISRQELGKDAQVLPRMIARDDRLFDLAQAQKAFEAEAQAADVIYSKSLALTGLQAYFDRLRQSSNIRAHNSKAVFNQRIQQLARQEISEIQEILKKLHIVEAEVIQQISIADRIAKNTKGPAQEQKGITGAKSNDVLRFPAEDEVWFDEIGNFKMDVKKACQGPKGKARSL